MAKTGLIIVIICFCFFLLVGGGAGLYYGNVACPSFGASCSPAPSPGTPSGSPVPTPSSGSTPSSGPAPSPTCPLTCSGSDLTLAKNYFDTQGVWHGVYTMTPNRGTKVDDNTCDVNYTYNQINGSDTGIDYRRFTYGSGCGKTVTAIGVSLSGTTAQ